MGDILNNIAAIANIGSFILACIVAIKANQIYKIINNNKNNTNSGNLNMKTGDVKDSKLTQTGAGRKDV